MSASIEPLRFGVLGTARIATKVAAAIRQADGAELFGIASRSKERALEWAQAHGAPNSYASYAELLADSDIDAVYIPLPPSMHKEWAINAAKAGKHVLCEKPLSVSTEDARQMAAVCEKQSVQLMDGVMWYHHPREAAMRQLIEQGQLSVVRRVTSAFTFNREFPDDDLRMNREMGGGSLLDLGWYCVGVSLWAFGEMPRRVFGSARYHRDVDLNFSAVMWFSKDRVATFDCGFDTVMRKWVEIAGTDAAIVCDEFTRPWDEDRPRFWLHQPDGQSIEHVSAAPIQEVCMMEEFCRLVRSGRPNSAWPKLSVQTQLVCEALDHSARTGEPVSIDDGNMVG